MQLSSLFTATAVLAASAVDARISGLGVPATIKPGDVFSVSGNQVISQPRQHTMVWGVGSASVGIYPGSIGTALIGKTDINSKFNPPPRPANTCLRQRICTPTLPGKHTKGGKGRTSLMIPSTGGILGGGYNITINDLQVPEGFTAGPATIQAAILQFNGVLNQPSVETWSWNVTIGDETSGEVVFVDIFNNTGGRGCSVSP